MAIDSQGVVYGTCQFGLMISKDNGQSMTVKNPATNSEIKEQPDRDDSFYLRHLLVADDKVLIHFVENGSDVIYTSDDFAGSFTLQETYIGNERDDAKGIEIFRGISKLKYIDGRVYRLELEETWEDFGNYPTDGYYRLVSHNTS